MHLIPPIAHGVTTVLMPKVDIRRMLQLIEEHRVTNALSIGPIARNHDLSGHRQARSVVLRLFATMSGSFFSRRISACPAPICSASRRGFLLGNPPDAPAFARHHTQGRSGCPLDEIRLLAPNSEEPVEPRRDG